LGNAAARLARVAERDSGASGLRETRRVDAEGVGAAAFSGMVEVVAMSCWVLVASCPEKRIRGFFPAQGQNAKPELLR
jgi:hypothetical protein